MTEQPHIFRDHCTSCETAVVRAYRELRGLGRDDYSAFRAAVHVLSLRHPERNPRECTDLVSEWLAEASAKH